MVYRLVLAFGSNIGDRKQNFAIALKYLQENDTSFQILKQSPFLITKPFQNPQYSIQNQEDYLNFVCEVITSVHPFRFYQDLIVPIEDLLGHSRTEKWASRALDIDILLAATNNESSFENCNPMIIDNENFSLPHKGLIEPERVVIRNILKDNLNLDDGCIQCHFQQILCEKN